MKFADSHTFAALEEKKSTFIAHLLPYDHFETVMEQLKAEHPKARHFIYAYRFLNNSDQIVEAFSDDGEPKGTSGMPTLKVLAGNGLINTAVITVRYFGGTLLGTGGLVRAYSDAANLVISEAGLLEYVKKETAVIPIPYELSSKAEYLATKHRVEIKEREFGQDGIKLHCVGEKVNLDTLHKLLV